ncbi:MAG: ABC-2 transporter permease [Ruminococcus sp.]|nr:ABC-2 transporter permease [Ruminococcus sp.]
MKGLLLKEFFMLKKNSIGFLLFIAVFLIGGFKGNPAVLFMLPLYMAILLYGHMNFDEQCKWQQYSMAMPYGRKMIVSSKYVAMAIAAVVSSIIVTIFYGVGIAIDATGFSSSSIVSSIILSLAIGIIYPTFILPLAYKFNSEKGRTIMLFLNGASGAIAVFLLSAIDGTGILAKLSNYTNILPYIATASVLVLFALSWLISVKIYEKRDL